MHCGCVQIPGQIRLMSTVHINPHCISDPPSPTTIQEQVGGFSTIQEYSISVQGGASPCYMCVVTFSAPCRLCAKLSQAMLVVYFSPQRYVSLPSPSSGFNPRLPSVHPKPSGGSLPSSLKARCQWGRQTPLPWGFL